MSNSLLDVYSSHIYCILLNTCSEMYFINFVKKEGYFFNACSYYTVKAKMLDRRAILLLCAVVSALIFC